MKTNKVCCFCERWGSGGIESFLHNVLMRMDLTQIQIDVIAVSLEQSVFTDPLRQHGVRFYELSGSQHDLWQNYCQFTDLLRKEKYDVIHFNLYHGLSLYYVHLAEQAGVPIRIVHSHNAALRKSAGKPLKLLVHNVAKMLFTDCGTDFWACSAPAAQFLFSRKAISRHGFRFIPNGIETERFQFNFSGREAVRTELGIAGEFVIGNVGRLCAQKNQEFLLDMFANLLPQKPASRLLLVGEGKKSDELKRKAARLGIADKVIFYGVSSHVEQLMWAMDAFVMPSHFEGLPVTGIEAQAAGLPCLFSENITEACKITPFSKFLPLSAGSAAWGQAVLELASEPRRREEGAELVRNAGFDIQMVSLQVQEQYMRSSTQ